MTKMKTMFRRHATLAFASIICGGSIASVAVSKSAAGPLLLTGAVRSDAGQPMEGVAVSAKISGDPVTITVFTDAEGRYYFPPFPRNGKYVVSGQAIGFVRGENQLALMPGLNRADFTLASTEAILPQMSGWQQLAMLPEDSREDRRGKALITRVCSNCHQTSRIFARKFDEKGWTGIIAAMLAMGGEAFAPKALTVHREEMAKYLARISGPGALPLRNRLPARPTGDPARALIYEYAVPTADGRYAFGTGSDWSKGPPVVAGAGISIHDATLDQDGNPWFTSTAPIPGRTIAKIDAVTGVATSYGYQADRPGGTGRAHSIITAKDGTLWFDHARGAKLLEGGLGFMNPRTGEIQSYVTPSNLPPIGGWVNEDGKGGIWGSAGVATGREGALRFDRATRTFQQFKSLRDGMTYGVTGDREGNGWWVQINADTIVYVDRKTGKVGEIEMPFTWAGAPSLRPGDMSKAEYLDMVPGIQQIQGNSQMPRRLKADMNADVVWIGNWAGDSLIKVDTKTKKTVYYPAPSPGMMPYDVAIDSQHRVWVGLQNGDEIARFDPDTEKWTIYPLPTKGVSARSISVIERDGHVEVVVPANDAHKVIRMIARTEDDVAALKARYYPAVNAQIDTRRR